MDAVADPDNINRLIILWLSDETVAKTATDDISRHVPILQNFSPTGAPENETVIDPRYMR